MKIYNSLTRKKDEITERKIGIYVCGPTVYDEPHIGHARSAYFFDCFVKYLRFRKFKVKFVRNVTDIDDKIIKRAKDETGSGTLKEKVKKISERYLKSYHRDLELLGLSKPDKEPKATEVIKDIVVFIKRLIKRGFAYEAGGSVYFDIRKFKSYGKLSRQAIDEMEEGARISLDKNKKDPLDFALWKTSKEDEPSWKSPWGEGRPGWHIECSVMSTTFLGKDFLIHGGGLDLVFPHHENEIAQTVCAGKKNAKYWMHNGLLTIDGQKMSKSLGNFVSIKDFINQYKNVNILKMLFLSTHYSHSLDYCQETIKQSTLALRGLQNFMWAVDRHISLTNKYPEFGLPQFKYPSLKFREEVNKYKNEFICGMDDDLNTPKALASLFNIRDFVQKHAINPMRVDIDDLKYAKCMIVELSQILGLLLEKEKIDQGLELYIKSKLKERAVARKEKNFKKADEIRNELELKNIIIEDTGTDTIWRQGV
ncbi:MAG: cysteine--tRNA ligase [Candidatus Omnitrophota bacterium]